jgi:glycosyltransferase involved in cell wall biosynthesis
MKVAIVVPGGLHPSGWKQVVPSWLALFGELAKQHEIHAFVLRHLYEPTTYSLLGFTVHDLGRPALPFGFRRWAQERALGFAMKKYGPFDLVHGFFADPAGRLAARAGQRLGIPSVVTCDSGEFVSLPAIDYGSQRTARGRSAVAEALALATQVHVCTEFMAAQAKAHGVLPVVIPLTTVGNSQPGPHRSPTPDPRSLRLLQVASLSRVKNQRLLIDALPIIRKTTNAHVELVGEDTLGGELQRHAEHLGLSEHVTFHGFVPHVGLDRFYENADIYVQTSLHEAAGVSVLEAAASGVPIVGTRAGYIADWAPERAAVIDAPTPELLAAAIATAAAHAESSSAAAAQAWARDRDVLSAAASFESLYRQLA